jgi:hypothetical protein
VSDVALMLNVISGRDPKDSTSAPNDVPDYLAQLEKPVESLRIRHREGVCAGRGIDSQVASAIDEAIRLYKKLGAEIVEVSLPHTSYGIAAYYIIAPCEASSNLARYDGVHYGHRTKDAVRDIIELYSKSRAEGFGEEVAAANHDRHLRAFSGYYDAYYLRALKIRVLIKQEFDEAFKKCDVILCPTSPIPAFKIGEKTGDPLQMYLTDVFTVTANIAAIPGSPFPAVSPPAKNRFRLECNYSVRILERKSFCASRASTNDPRIGTRAARRLTSASSVEPRFSNSLCNTTLSTSPERLSRARARKQEHPSMETLPAALVASTAIHSIAADPLQGPSRASHIRRLKMQPDPADLRSTECSRRHVLSQFSPPA